MTWREREPDPPSEFSGLRITRLTRWLQEPPSTALTFFARLLQLAGGALLLASVWLLACAVFSL
jgi:hypothetical protein